MTGPNLCSIELGRITAAAGHGKTQLIASSLLTHQHRLPVLVLTHTNAGVHSLRNRLRHLGVASDRYRLETIDAFMLKLVRSFPHRSNHRNDPLNGVLNYPALHAGALQLLADGHLDAIVPANYARLFVDEYQDCVSDQHLFVKHLARMVPTSVLGDPLQAVFGFAGRLAQWNEVGEHFTEHVELDTPWRWRNAKNDALGSWLLDVRRQLLAEQPIDLSTSPACVSVIINKGDARGHEQRIEASRSEHCRPGETVLVIGDAMNEESRLNVARQVHGLTPIEPVEHKRSLIKFMDSLDLSRLDLDEFVIRFAASVMIGMKPAETIKRLKSLRGGKSRKPASDLEQSALELVNTPSFGGVRDFLQACQSAPKVRAFRPQVIKLVIHALEYLEVDAELTPAEAGRRSRERSRHQSMRLPARGIGSTLLLKGLECDHAVILNGESLNRKDLYVALTRAKLTITICTETATLTPRK